MHNLNADMVSHGRSLLAGKTSLRSILALVAVFGLTLYLINLGGTRVLTYHETVSAQPAREMLRTGNWVIPTYNGVASNQKPPIVYWAIAASMFFFQSDAEWVVRFPAALATVATAVWIAWLTAYWHGRHVALLAGLIQLTTFYCLMQGRLGEADMLLCLEIAVAMGVFALANVAGPTPVRTVISIGPWTYRVRSLLAMIYYAACGLTFLTKGPLGPVLVLGGCASYVLFRRDWRVIAFFFEPTGVAIFAVTVVAWPAAAYLQCPEIVHDWWQHNVDRFMGKEVFGVDGTKPFYFYFLMLPLLLLPWTPFTLVGLRTRREASIRPFWQFLACWFGYGFAVLWMSAWQHKHYLIPVLPPLTIMAAVGLLRTMDANRIRLRSVAATFATIWTVAVSIQTFAMPYFDSYKGQAELAQRVNQQLPKNHPLLLVDLPENQIAYYLREPIVRVDVAVRMAENIAGKGTTCYLLAPAGLAKRLRELGSVEIIDQATTLRRRMPEQMRLTLFRLHPNKSNLALRQSGTTR